MYQCMSPRKVKAKVIAGLKWDERSPRAEIAATSQSAEMSERSAISATLLSGAPAPAVIAPAPAERTKSRPNVPMNSLSSRLARWRSFVQSAR